MDLEFIMELKSTPDWRILKRQILSKEFAQYKNRSQKLNSYQLVHVLVDENEKPIIEKQNPLDTNSYLVFTTPSLASRLETTFKREEIESAKDFKLQAPTRKLKIMMIGHLVEELKHCGMSTSIKVNPLYIEAGAGLEPFLYAEEVLFAPQFDEVTQKYLMSDPDDAKALLAIRPEEEKRFGIEIIYYLITTRGLPDEQEEREKFLKDRIEELAFMAPRIPIKKGSGSFLAVLLNLENDLEERAFIRDYPMFDDYSDSLFVTSQLMILSGALEEIHYNGDKIDTIFTPMIQWQRSH
jgi:hypothetical protein